MTKYDILHFGLDHLEIFGTFKDETIFDSLDFDNSNYSEFGEYNITKNEVKKFQYKIIFNKDNYTLFSYYNGLPKSKSNPVATRDYIVIYSTAFSILEPEEIVYFLQIYLNLQHNRRFDICIDVNENISSILKRFKTPLTGREYRKSGSTETMYIGEVRNSLNKRQIIRIYNKIKDIVDKRKTKLYSSYLLEDYVTRIELEVRQELAKNINYIDLLNGNDSLLGIFKNYLHDHTSIFEDIQSEKITLFKKKDKIDPALFQGLYYKHFKVNNFLGHAKTVYNMGFCPVRVLIGEGYIQHKTVLALGVEFIDEIIEAERKVKRHAVINKAIRQDFKNLIDNYPNYE